MKRFRIHRSVKLMTWEVKKVSGTRKLGVVQACIWTWTTYSTSSLVEAIHSAEEAAAVVDVEAQVADTSTLAMVSVADQVAVASAVDKCSKKTTKKSNPNNKLNTCSTTPM